MNLGVLLKAYRKSQRLTQKEMAARIDISREYYSRLEQGVGRPSITLLERICSSIAIPSEKLFVKADSVLLRQEFIEICDLCRSLRAEDRKEIHTQIKQMLKQ